MRALSRGDTRESVGILAGDAVFWRQIAVAAASPTPAGRGRGGRALRGCKASAGSASGACHVVRARAWSEGGYLAAMWRLRGRSASLKRVSMGRPRAVEVYAVGGSEDFQRRPLATAEAFDPMTAAWEALPEMASGRALLAAASAGELLYGIGGHDGLQAPAQTWSKQRFLWQSCTWEPEPTSPDMAWLETVGLRVLEVVCLSVC